VISGILKVGCRWQDTPAAYGPHTTIYNRYNRWSQRGIWQRLFEKIVAVGPVPTELMLDSSHVKAHRSAAGGKGGLDPGDRPLEGGSMSKIHCLADGRARPVALALTPGNVAESSGMGPRSTRRSAPATAQTASGHLNGRVITPALASPAMPQVSA
jgi:hypothetical protein